MSVPKLPNRSTCTDHRASRFAWLRRPIEVMKALIRVCVRAGEDRWPCTFMTACSAVRARFPWPVTFFSSRLLLSREGIRKNARHFCARKAVSPARLAANRSAAVARQDSGKPGLPACPPFLWLGVGRTIPHYRGPTPLHLLTS